MDSSDVFTVLSNEVRRGILLYISRNKIATFTELMRACNLDVSEDCGTLGYHLNILIGEGVIKKGEKGYEFTDFGLQLADLLVSFKGMEMKKDKIKGTIMTFGRGSSLVDCAGTLAKHAKKGDKVYNVVEWDLPKGAIRTEMMEAAKEILEVTGVVSLADYGVPQTVGERVPFLEHILVPPLITIIQEIRPNIIITFDPGTSATPTVLETIGRCVHRAVEHAIWPYWRGERNLSPLEEYPKFYYWTWREGRNYIVDISNVLEQKKEYAALFFYNFQRSKAKTLEDGRKLAETLPNWEGFKATPIAFGYSQTKMDKHEYLNR